MIIGMGLTKADPCFFILSFVHLTGVPREAGTSDILPTN